MEHVLVTVCRLNLARHLHAVVELLLLDRVACTSPTNQQQSQKNKPSPREMTMEEALSWTDGGPHCYGPSYLQYAEFLRYPKPPLHSILSQHNPCAPTSN